MTDITWGVPTLAETNALLAEHHYLGPSKSGGKHLFGGWVDGKLVAAQVWRSVTARRLNSPAILELSRWCLTPPAGANAGSRMHKYAVAELRKSSEVEILVSYSDPSAGHGGSLYRACNWLWAPTWSRTVGYSRFSAGPILPWSTCSG